MRKTKYISRHVNDCFIHDIPMSGTNGLDVPADSVRIKEKGLHTSTYDLGSVAFKKRKSTRTRIDGKSSYVDIVVVNASLCQIRVSVLKNIIEGIHDNYKIGRHRESTLVKFVYDFIRFAAWCDDNNHELFLESVEKAKNALEEFNLVGLELARAGTCTLRSVGVLSSGAACVLCLGFEIEVADLKAGIYFPKIHASSPTVPPNEYEAQKSLNVMLSLFLGLHELIIGKRNFPYKLNMPSFYVWLFPTSKWFATEDELSNRDNWGRKTPYIDYRNGKYLKYDEMKEAYPESRLKKQYVEARVDGYAKANTNNNHIKRKEIAFIGCKAFMMLFIANTKMNYSSVADLKWDQEYDVSSGLLGFKTIKYRADGREVEYIITTTFLKYFEKYLELRKYLLGSGSCEYLFFHINHDRETVRIDSHTTKTFKETCERLVTGESAYISARRLRAFGANFTVKKHGLSTAALLLQNEIKTVNESYSETSDTDAALEMASYFDDFNEKIIVPRSSKLTNVTAGSCKKQNNPSSINIYGGILPDCVQPEGCLFCENFAVHADKESVSKLLSLKYVINETEHLANNRKHFKIIYEPTLKRIDSIVSEIGKKSKRAKKIVSSVKKEIQLENLNPYWDAKLEMLFDIGAID